MAYNIFISYNHKSDEIAKKLERSLTRVGHSVFLDTVSINVGESIPESVRLALNSCRHVLCLITEDWIKSEFCKLELDTSIMSDPSAKSRKIIPLILQNGVELPYDLRRIKSLDFTDWTTDYRRLLADLKRAIV